jgi:nitrogen fixation/metabolism regulation signal transduction histidine kinase
MLFVSGLIVIQVAMLIYFLNGINRDLARFLIYLLENDTSLEYNQEKIERNFKGLHGSFRLINNQFKKIKIDREAKTLFLNNVVNHMKVAFMAYDESEKVVLFNNAAKNTFNQEFRTLDEIQSKNLEFYNFLKKLPNNFSGVYNYGNTKTDSWPLLVRSSGFILAGEKIRLLSFQNIKSQLDSNELESWQKLMRVLAHEISNSVAPITMLGNNIRRHLENSTLKPSGTSQYPKNIVKDMIRSSELIEQRGHRLIEFIESYKSYAKLPQPALANVSVKDLFNQIENYFEEQFQNENIIFSSSCEPNANMQIDLSLVEQVLINLIQNSMQALKSNKNKVLNLNHKTLNGHTIEVIDNGIGIPDEIADKIFIPFFTTKENGSGIGLSLSKNIMHMHKGSIKIQSGQNLNTVITLNFPE